MFSQQIVRISTINFAAKLSTFLLAVVTIGTVGCNGTGMDETDESDLAIEASAPAAFPTACTGSATTGLCVLADTSLTGGFTVSVCTTSGACTSYAVNQKIALTPNATYTLWMYGINAYGVSVKVPSSGITTVKTGTVVFQTSGTVELQVKNDTISSGKCLQNGDVHVQYNAGSYALLPGTYIADFGGTCTANEKSFTVAAGASVTVAR